MKKKAKSPFLSVMIERDPIYIDASTVGGSSHYLVSAGETWVTITANPSVPHSDLMAVAYADSLCRSFPNLKVEVK